MAHYSVNKIINRIITTLEAYDAGSGSYPFKDKCHNHFGHEEGETGEQSTLHPGHIYIFYGDEDYVVSTNAEYEIKLYITLYVYDQLVGVSSTRSDFQADVLRSYLTSSDSGDWPTLGIPIDYASMDVSPFFVESITPLIPLDEEGEPEGYIWTIFRGYSRFFSRMKS